MINKFKKRDHKPNYATSEKTVECHDLQPIVNSSLESIGSEKPDIPTPAVTFGTGIYTANTSYEVSEALNVYTTMLDVDRDIINHQMYLYEQNKNLPVCGLQLETIERAYMHMFDIASSNFEASIDNCIMVHLANLTRLFDIDGVSAINFIDDNKFDDNRLMRQWANIAPLVIQYQRSFDEIHDIIINGTVFDQIQSYINEVGNNVYTYIRKCLNRLFADMMTKDQNVIATIIGQVNQEFSRLMQDLCYEGSVYMYNITTIVNLSPIIPDQLEEMEKNVNYNTEVEPF